MANAGSIVTSLIVNADGAKAGFDVGIKAAETASKSIGASLDRINKKQLTGAASNILKNFVSPAALAVGGAEMATNLIKGFSTGTYKNWQDAGQGLMAALKTGIESIPIVGTFAQLGGAIGNAVFGIDAATKSLTETNKQMAITDELVKSLKSRSDTALNAEQNLRDKIANIGKTQDQKDLDAYKKSLEAKDAEALKSVMKQYDAQQKVLVRPTRRVTIEETKHGTIKETIEPLRDFMARMTQYEKDMEAAVADRARVEKMRAEEFSQNTQQKLKDFADQQGVLADAIQAEKEKTEALKAQNSAAQTLNGTKLAGLAIDKKAIETAALAQEKFDQHMQDKIADAREDVDNAALRDEERKRGMGATSVSSAIGSIAVKGAVDFSKSLELEQKQKALDAAIKTRDDVAAIEETLRKVLATP